MRILHLLDEFPYPPEDGPRIPAFNLIKYMSFKHECHLLSFEGRNGRERQAEFCNVVPNTRILGVFPMVEGLGLQAGRLKRLIRGDPVALARVESREFRAALGQALRISRYDLIHLHGFTVTSYLGACSSKPTVISSVDAISLAYARASELASGLRNAYLKLAARSIKRYERSVFPLAGAVQVVSDVDRRYLASVIPACDVETIPQGLTDEVLNFPLPKTVDSPGPRRLLFSGSFKNPDMAKGLLEFLHHAYPDVLERFPDAEMVVLGRYAPPSLVRTISCIRNTTFLSWVEDYCAELSQARVVILPDLAGTGIKNRTLYAMALGKPIVGSTSALEGIPVENGIHCFVCSTPSDFSDKVRRLLEDGELRRRMGAEARQLVLENYAPEVVGQRWEELYGQVIARFQGAP